MFLKLSIDAGCKKPDMDMLLPIVTPYYKGFIIGLFVGAVISAFLVGLWIAVKERCQDERLHGVMKTREYSK